MLELERLFLKRFFALTLKVLDPQMFLPAMAEDLGQRISIHLLPQTKTQISRQGKVSSWFVQNYHLFSTTYKVSLLRRGISYSIVCSSPQVPDTISVWVQSCNLAPLNHIETYSFGGLSGSSKILMTSSTVQYPANASNHTYNECLQRLENRS